MRYYTGNPVADHLRYEADREEWLECRPVCECCGEHIQEEYAFYYNDQWFCRNDECEEELMKTIWEDIKNDYLVPVEE